MAPIFAGTSQHGFPVRSDGDEPLRRRRRRAHLRRRRRYGGHRLQHDARTCRTSRIRNPSIRSSTSSAGTCGIRAGRVGSAAAAPPNSPTRCTRRRTAGSTDCSPAPARRCPMRSASAAACRGRHPHRARRGHRYRRQHGARASRCRARSTRSTARSRSCRPSTSGRPMDLGDVWYHSWQAGGGYGDPLRRDPARVALDVERNAVSAAGGQRHLRRRARRRRGGRRSGHRAGGVPALRAARLQQATVPEPGDAVVSFAGSGPAVDRRDARDRFRQRYA